MKVRNTLPGQFTFIDHQPVTIAQTELLSDETRRM